jgi:hypothetical protein
MRFYNGWSKFNPLRQVKAFVVHRQLSGKCGACTPGPRSADQNASNLPGLSQLSVRHFHTLREVRALVTVNIRHMAWSSSRIMPINKDRRGSPLSNVPPATAALRIKKNTVPCRRATKLRALLILKPRLRP